MCLCDESFRGVCTAFFTVIGYNTFVRILICVVQTIMCQATKCTEKHVRMKLNLVFYELFIFFLGDIGNYYYGQGHPMKPHRIRMTHNLLLNYGLYRKMEIYVSFSFKVFLFGYSLISTISVFTSARLFYYIALKYYL